MCAQSLLSRVQRLGSRQWVLLALCAAGLLLFGAFGSARAQIEIPDLQRLSPSSRVDAGVRLLRKGRPRAAISLLRPVLRVDSVWTASPHGAVAYWLGEAYKQAGQPEEAHSTWHTGLRTLQGSGQFDVRLADAYLRGLTPEELRGDRLYAVDVYRSLLRRVGSDTSSAVQALFRRRIAQIAPLMPDEVLAQVIEQRRSTDASEWTFRSEGGAVLAEWWRGLDPMPATDANERLEEHLTRLVRVQQEFKCSERVAGIDDRGVIQLRFGAPYKRRSIDYKDGKFFKEVYRAGVQVPPSSFPQSEIWLYPHIDESGYYLFAEEETSNCYAIARANDLIPDYLTRRRSDNERGLNIAYSAMMALRAVYQELALYHINFSNRYADIANYVDRQKMKAIAAQAEAMADGEYNSSGADRSVVVGSGIGQTRRVFENPILGLEFPTRFVPQLVKRAEREDRAAAKRRREAMPRQHTTLLEGTAHLPVSMRTARFLSEDGTTRTEVYWGVPSSGLRLETKDDSVTGTSSLISFSAVRYDADHRVRQRVSRRYPVDMGPGDERRMFVPPSVTLEGTAELYHLGLQWEQYELWRRDSSSLGGSSLGPRRRIATARTDSLVPLRAEGPRVEMSDVKIMTLPSGESRSPANPAAQATPYPFRTLSADTPLLLTFEVYHLSYGAGDRTRYTVSYEVKGETKRGWKELFLGDETQRTSTEMTMKGTSRRTRETILLDLSKVSHEEPQEVRVTVRVTDEVSGTTVSRDVDFLLRSRPPSN